MVSALVRHMMSNVSDHGIGLLLRCALSIYRLAATPGRLLPEGAAIPPASVSRAPCGGHPRRVLEPTAQVHGALP